MIDITDPVATLGTILSFFLTVMVLLYAFGDNALFRLTIHIFIGVAAGYAGAVALRDVLIPRLTNLTGTDFLIASIWVTLLVMKISPKTAFLGNPASGMLVGVGAAIAIGGAIQGTIIPQVTSTSNLFSLDMAQTLKGSLILVGTLSTLIHFHFGARYTPNQIPQRSPIVKVISWIGQSFIAVTFGVLFAGIFSAALVALIERFEFIVDFLENLFSLMG